MTRALSVVLCHLASALIVVGASGETSAAHLVVFEDGRALRVTSFSFEGGHARLRLEAGALIVVPADGIATIEAASTIEDGGEEPAAEESSLAAAEVAELAAALEQREAWRQAAGRFAELIADTADRHGLPRALLAAVAKTESNFDPYAVSRKGACGLLQLMPATARRFGVRKIFDVAQNLDGGAQYLRWLLDRFDGDLSLALAGYNAGEGAVDRHGGVPPYRETRAYVARVLDRAAETPR